MVALDAARLPLIESVPTPSYDRSACSVGIVHFGFGNFHRSHQAVYLDRLMEAGHAHHWGICGVGVLASDAAMRDAMTAQDCLYTVLLRHSDGTFEPRVVGSVLSYLFGPEQPQEVLDLLTRPEVRIVSLTVTEGGYLKDPASGRFDASHPSVLHDLEHPDRPQTAFAFIAEGLRRRRDAGIAPFTVLSCDNLQGNGAFARQAVTSFARLFDPALADWISGNVEFPSCMVDRITPATTDADRAALADRFGIEDRWPVTAEPFTQWIVEDEFPTGRPPLEEVGVQFVDDVKPYELMKLRLLNGSHQALAYLGAALDHVLVDEAMGDDLVRDFLRAYMAREAAPTLGELPGVDLDAYMAAVIDRFGNPMMRDTLARLATDGSNRMATFVLPTIRANVAAQRPSPLGAFVVAAWALLWESVARGEPPHCGVPDDANAAVLLEAARRSDLDPTAFVEVRTVFGDLAEDAGFRQAYAEARTLLAVHGMHEALAVLLACDTAR